jgi:hypothetical protein
MLAAYDDESQVPHINHNPQQTCVDYFPLSNYSNIIVFYAQGLRIAMTKGNYKCVTHRQKNKDGDWYKYAILCRYYKYNQTIKRLDDESVRTKVEHRPYSSNGIVYATQQPISCVTLTHKFLYDELSSSSAHFDLHQNC